MPQMAPLNWLTLYIFFFMIFMLFNMINYYSFFYTVKKDLIKKKSTSLNWKW
uniref:ATP synthase complex subunit 8 n=1 Tax=Massicus raddei TaxID=157316 RepID=X2CF76_MASRA|nr:ATP synthase F0 subunit 8 [Massicus raddei]AGO01997.1 ATP synthase F0 subunit 8 [Massicus raddei]